MHQVSCIVAQVFSVLMFDHRTSIDRDRFSLLSDSVNHFIIETSTHGAVLEK
jgi:hypothetical protein